MTKNESDQAALPVQECADLAQTLRSAWSDAMADAFGFNCIVEYPGGTHSHLLTNEQSRTFVGDKKLCFEACGPLIAAGRAGEFGGKDAARFGVDGYHPTTPQRVVSFTAFHDWLSTTDSDSIQTAYDSIEYLAIDAEIRPRANVMIEARLHSFGEVMDLRALFKSKETVDNSSVIRHS